MQEGQEKEVVERPTISANILLGPFEEPYLQWAIGSICWVDEIVVIANNPSKGNVERLHACYDFTDNINVVDYYEYHDHFKFDHARNLGEKVSTSKYVWKVDADEVYFDSFQDTCNHLSYKFDLYKVMFIHMFYDLGHYRFVADKEVLHRVKQGFRWAMGVHEHLVGAGSSHQLVDQFMHLGYIKSNEDIFKKWILYATLEGEPDRYGNPDVRRILDGVEVLPYDGKYPEVMERIELLPWLV